MANAQNVAKVEAIQKLFEEANSFFITEYQGLDVAQLTDLRRSLREKSVTYLVAKNTLFRLAAKNSGQPVTDDHFRGPTAVAFTSDDAAAAAKVLHDSYKDRELPRVRVFVVDSDLFDGEDIKRLADLPPKEVLLAQVAAAVEAPLTSLVGSIDGFFRELVGSIDALAAKRETEG
jgi:large subunit ribosomal protein L10